MSDTGPAAATAEITTSGQGNTQGASGTQDTDQSPSFEAITSQDQFDKILGQRLSRERAKYADYDEVKAKAGKLDEIEQANKTELQKLQERADAAEKRASKAEKESVRAAVASAKGVPVSSLSGDTREELEASADDLIAWRDKNAPAPKKVTTATSGGGLKSGASGSGGTNLTPKALAAERLRQMRTGG
jgi:hypothetical protein